MLRTKTHCLENQNEDFQNFEEIVNAVNFECSSTLCRNKMALILNAFDEDAGKAGNEIPPNTRV